MAIQRFLFNIPSDQIERTADFYVKLFGFEIIWRNEDWYVQLARPDNQSFHFGIIRRNYPFLPQQLQLLPQGVILTIQVDNVEAIYQEAIALGHQIVQPIRDEEFGQRHFLMLDPNKLVINVSMPIPMSERFAANAEPRANAGKSSK
jgi:predicted enzyme related to lactoylglutathione lyase